MIRAIEAARENVDIMDGDSICHGAAAKPNLKEYDGVIRKLNRLQERGGSDNPPLFVTNELFLL